jgi:FAD:protein FMN transferase
MASDNRINIISMRFLILILFSLASLAACQKQNAQLLTLTGLTMGTTYSVKIVATGITDDRNVIHDDIETILQEVNLAMSTYIKDSELSLLNQSNVIDEVSLSDDLYFVIEHSNNISLMTDGAFDITIGPLVNLWGFGPDPFTREIPSDRSIDALKQQTGYEKIRLNKAVRTIAKTDPDLTLDLSGIAKGFAVDKIANYLNKNNYQNYLVEIGGELIGKGKNVSNKSWLIGIEQANPLKRSVQRIVRLDNIALATSGDYRNYFEKNGVRYSHTIDPITGKPINHQLASVTVLDKSTMYADALATAFMVLGTNKTHTLANKLGIPVYTMTKTKTGFKERYNDFFKPYLLH